MMRIPDPRCGFVRALGLAAAAMLMLSAAPVQRAEALSLINPAAVPTAKYASEGLTAEVRGGHGGHGHGGGGFHGGGHRGGGFHGGHVFHSGGFRHHGFAFRHHRFHRHVYYAPSYYYYPHRRCRVIWTHYGPRRICHHRHWRYHHWRHHHRHHRFY
jgi:hypothetical protein